MQAKVDISPINKINTPYCILWNQKPNPDNNKKAAKADIIGQGLGSTK
jgi:hypothetical protein